MAPEVFISHAPTSAKTAKKLAEVLRARGVSAWSNVELPLNGGQWRSVTRKALEASQAIIFVIEPRREPGSRVRDEWSEALLASWSEPSKRLVPLLIGDAEAPAFLKIRHALRIRDTSAEVERAAHEIAEALHDEGYPLGAIDPTALEQARVESRRRLEEVEAAVQTLWPRE